MISNTRLLLPKSGLTWSTQERSMEEETKFSF